MNETDPVTFTCSATGIPPPKITWMRNAVVVDENTEPRISLNFSNPETVSTADGDIYLVTRTLTISSTRDGDSDNYTCVASNGNTVTPNVTRDFEVVVQGRLPFYLYVCTHILCGFHPLLPTNCVYYSCSTHCGNPRQSHSYRISRCLFCMPGHWQTKASNFVGQTRRHGPVTISIRVNH